jgi:hypothetical protein
MRLPRPLRAFLAKQMLAPIEPLYLPDELELAHTDSVRSTHDLSLNNMLTVSKLFLVGSAGFSIVVFNSALSILSIKSFEGGVPESISHGISLLSASLLISFGASGASYIGAFVAIESFAAVKHSMAKENSALYREAKADYVKRLASLFVKVGIAGAFFLVSLTISVGVLNLVLTTRTMTAPNYSTASSKGVEKAPSPLQKPNQIVPRPH